MRARRLLKCRHSNLNSETCFPLLTSRAMESRSLLVRGLPPRMSEKELFDAFSRERGFRDARLRTGKEGRLVVADVPSQSLPGAGASDF